MTEYTKEEVFDLVRRCVAEQAGISETVVRAESRLEQDLGADSPDRVEIVMAIEEEFEVELGESCDDAETVQQLIDETMKHVKIVSAEKTE